jgi:hypothetical protein
VAMASDRDQIGALVVEQPFVSVATDRDVDSPSVKIVKITEDVCIALKKAKRGNDPLSIINQTGMRAISYSSSSTTCFSNIICIILQVL